MMLGFEAMLSGIDRTTKANLAGQVSLFGGGDDSLSPGGDEVVIPDMEEYDTAPSAAHGERNRRALPVGHPLTQYRELIASRKLVQIGDIMDSQNRPGAKYGDGSYVRMLTVVQSRKIKATKNDPLWPLWVLRI